MTLFRPRNQFAFAAGRPGINPNHPASGGLRYSAVAVNGNMVNLVDGQPATIHGTITPGIDGRTGPYIQNVTSSAYLSTVGINDTSLSAVTLAAVFIPIAGDNAFNVIFSSNNGTANGNDTWLYISIPLNPVMLVGGNILGFGTITLTAGVPYFIAVSYNGAKASCIALDARNGSYIIETVTVTHAIGSPNSSTYLIAGTPGSRYMDGQLSAVMYGVNNFLSASQLTTWAQSFGDFWFPQDAQSLLLSTGKPTSSSRYSIGGAPGLIVPGVGKKFGNLGLNQ